MMLDLVLKENLMDEYYPDTITVAWNELLEDCVFDLENKDAAR